MLPDIDGLDICRRIRADAPTPILMLSARGQTTERITGLDMGADDYLPKLFDPRELLARLREMLRRASETRETRRDDVLVFGRLEVDRGARQIRIDGPFAL